MRFFTVLGSGTSWRKKTSEPSGQSIGHRRIGIRCQAEGGQLGDLGLIVRADLPAERGLPEPRERGRVTVVQHDLHEVAHPANATGVSRDHARQSRRWWPRIRS
jgi:hypothetical protein